MGTLIARARQSVGYRARHRLYDVRQATLAARLARGRQQRLSDEVQDDATIITVTWNSLPFLEALLAGVERYTSPPPPVVVVDNASTDGTGDFLRSQPGIVAIELDRNVGHGPALDIGVHAARSRYIVTLDVDAFPISPDWLDAVIRPLKEGYSVAGAICGYPTGYIHPSFMAMERRRFLEGRHTFAACYNGRLRRRRRGDPKIWDTGKLITVRDPGPHYGIAVSSVRGPGAMGTVFGDVVYHHYYGTRINQLPENEVALGLTPELSLQAWQEAVHRYL